MPRFSALIFFRQFELQVFLFLFLFTHVLINCNLYTWQLLHTRPIQKSGNFLFQKGKKETAHHCWTLFLKSISRLLWYTFLFLTEHNPSFTLFLIYSYFFTQSELRCSYKVCSCKKKDCIVSHSSHGGKKTNMIWQLLFPTKDS